MNESGQNVAPPSEDGPANVIGLRYRQLDEDLARAEVPVTPELLQPGGVVHGGVYSLIAESLCSQATLNEVAPRGLVAMGQSNSATFLRPITEGTIHALARRHHAGRTTWVWDAEFSDDQGRTCALVRMTLAVRPPPG